MNKIEIFPLYIIFIKKIDYFEKINKLKKRFFSFICLGKMKKIFRQNYLCFLLT